LPKQCGLLFFISGKNQNQKPRPPAKNAGRMGHPSRVYNYYLCNRAGWRRALSSCARTTCLLCLNEHWIAKLVGATVRLRQATKRQLAKEVAHGETQWRRIRNRRGRLTSRRCRTRRSWRAEWRRKQQEEFCGWKEEYKRTEEINQTGEFDDKAEDAAYAITARDIS
jgi:hypothetical protein